MIFALASQNMQSAKTCVLFISLLESHIKPNPIDPISEIEPTFGQERALQHPSQSQGIKPSRVAILVTQKLGHSNVP